MTPTERAVLRFVTSLYVLAWLAAVGMSDLPRGKA